MEEAARHYARSLQLDPKPIEAINNLGASLSQIGRRAEALVVLCHAVEQDPANVAAWSNLGVGAKNLGDVQTALLCFDRALSLQPDHANTRWDRSICLLASGKLSEGWADFDWRWKAGAKGEERPFFQPCWDGSDLRDKTILVWMEQGLGDQIVFASMLPDLVRAGAHVIVECEPRLVDLLKRSFPATEVVARTTPPDPRTSQPDIQFQIPAGSLARFLRPSLEGFPRERDYLVADRGQVERWKTRLNFLGGGLKAGICWRSSVGKGMRAMHYARLSQWGPILAIPGVQFVNLQYDQCDEELREAERLFGAHVHVWDDIDLKNDQDSVAALISALDLVISARTAVAAMAGAVGAQTLVLTRNVTDWWGLGTDHCPWLPSVRAFHCSANDPWEPAIAGIAADLGQLAEARSRASNSL